jgi:DNA-binding response OmpR family regulator
MINDTKKILLVDDEAKIVEVLKSYLLNDGYAVCEACNGKEALEVFAQNNPHLVVLDLMLPDLPGEEICQIIRKNSRVPIIMLTARSEEEDILKGLDIGADDYIVKPFSPRQLLARIRALLRRTSDDLSLLANIISYHNNDLVIDTIKHEIKKSGTMVNLTPNEYKILITLLKYPHKTFTREELISLAIGDDYEGYDRIIDTHIKNLRQKIETDPKDPRYILTVHGIGYKFGGE